jgi:hypothetical protein
MDPVAFLLQTLGARTPAHRTVDGDADDMHHSAACRCANDRQPRCGCCSCRHGSGRRHVRRSEAALAVRPDRRKDLIRWRRALRSGRCQVRKGPDVR